MKFLKAIYAIVWAAIKSAYWSLADKKKLKALSRPTTLSEAIDGIAFFIECFTRKSSQANFLKLKDPTMFLDYFDQYIKPHFLTRWQLDATSPIYKDIYSKFGILNIDNMFRLITVCAFYRAKGEDIKLPLIIGHCCNGEDIKMLANNWEDLMKGVNSETAETVQ